MLNVENSLYEEKGMRVVDLQLSDITESWGSNPEIVASLKSAGGVAVRGTPWIPGSKDNILRIYYSHEDYARFTQELLKKIQESQIQYDAVLTMPRGGVGIGAGLARGLGIELGYVHAQSYGHSERAGEVDFGEFNFPKSLQNKLDAWLQGEGPQPRVLLADDMADSGATFQKTIEKLTTMGFLVDTATIFQKTPSSIVPDYTVFKNYPPVWIAQPGEAWIESSTKGNNVEDIQNSLLSQLIKSISSSVGDLINNASLKYGRIDRIEYIVRPESLGAPAGVLASASRMLQSVVGKRVQHIFSTVRQSNIGYMPQHLTLSDGTKIELAVYLNDKTLTIQLPTEITLHT